MRASCLKCDLLITLLAPGKHTPTVLRPGHPLPLRPSETLQRSPEVDAPPPRPRRHRVHPSARHPRPLDPGVMSRQLYQCMNCMREYSTVHAVLSHQGRTMLRPPPVTQSGKHTPTDPASSAPDIRCRCALPKPCNAAPAWTRPHPARAGTAYTPAHATRDRSTRARACRRPSDGACPPGTAQSRAQEHGTPEPAPRSERPPRGHAQPPAPAAPAPSLRKGRSAVTLSSVLAAASPTLLFKAV